MGKRSSPAQSPHTINVGVTSGAEDGRAICCWSAVLIFKVHPSCEAFASSLHQIEKGCWQFKFLPAFVAGDLAAMTNSLDVFLVPTK
jgi:hypothetical protein